MTDGRGLSRRDVLISGAGALTLPQVTRSARAQGKPSGLNMLYATVEADSDAIKLVLPDLKREFGFDIHLDTMPYNSLQQKVFAELASGSSYYDIMIVDTPWMPALTHKIQPVTDMILDRKATANAALDIGDFIPKVFFDTAVYKPDASHVHWEGSDAIDPEAVKRAGFEIYGLPIQANALVLAYRRDLFSNPTEQRAFKAKYNRDLAVPAIWEQHFTPVAEFFTRPAKRLWGTTLMAGAGDWATDDFKTLLACFGGNGHMINDKLQVEFDTPQGVAALTYYVDLIRKYNVTPPGTTSANWDTAATEFSTGLAAMSMNYHTETLSPMVKGEIGYAMVPKQVQYGPHFGTWMLSVNSFSKNKDWAWRAIQWFTGKQAQEKMLATQLHPTRRSVFRTAEKDPAMTRKFGNFYEVLGNSLEVGVGRPRLTNYSDVDRAIWVAVNNAATGAEQPAQALANAARQVERLLKEAGYAK